VTAIPPSSALFCAALALDRPAVLGCSIGGRIVLDLAIRHAAEFRALIGLEAADYQAPWYDTSWLHRPDVHGGEVCAGLVSGLIAPQSPDVSRWETLWHYLQGGPASSRATSTSIPSRRRRLASGSDRHRHARSVPLFLLTGEYDFSCTPEDTMRTATRIPGAEVVVMKELGHFPMSENPAQFRGYILPVLERIRQTAVGVIAPLLHAEHWRA